MELTEERLKEIEARSAAATPGQWNCIMERGMPDEERGLDIYFGWGVTRDLTEADQKFIVGARQDVPLLLAEVRRLREVENEREEARGLAREYLYALWEEDSEEVRKAAREAEARFHPWLLEPEPATATGVWEAVVGMTQIEEKRDA